MKNTIFKFGLKAGLILSVCMAIAMLIFKQPSFKEIGLKYGMAIGYTYMVVSFFSIYQGIKYHKEHSGGVVGFGNALLIGLGITLIACVLYSLTWLVIYYNFIPDYLTDYMAYALDQARAEGAGPEKLAEMAKEFETAKNLYKTPLSTFGITLLEPMPVGVLASLISAGVLSRKKG